MPKRWTRFTNPAHDELLSWFKSDEAGTLRFDDLHPVAQDALTKYQSEFSDPFPRVESHGHYVFGMFAAPTSIEDDTADFYTIHYLANFEQIVTVLRAGQASSRMSSPFDLSIIQVQLDNAIDLFDHPDWSVGMAIANIAELFITNIEQSVDALKKNVQTDLELVTSESRQIPSDADPEYLSELYRRTALHKTEVVSLKTLLYESKNVLKAVSSDQVDVRRNVNNIDEDLFTPFVEVTITDLLMRTRHLTSIRDNMEADLELMFERFQEIQSSQQTDVARKLTGVFSILLFPQLVAGYFGQNFEKTPGYRTEFGWLYSLILMLVIAVIQFYWLRRKKYL